MEKRAYTGPQYQHHNCLLSPLFIDELAVDSLQAALPLQLSSAFLVSVSHARAVMKGTDKLGGNDTDSNSNLLLALKWNRFLIHVPRHSWC